VTGLRRLLGGQAGNVQLAVLLTLLGTGTSMLLTQGMHDARAAQISRTRSYLKSQEAHWTAKGNKAAAASAAMGLEELDELEASNEALHPDNMVRKAVPGAVALGVPIVGPAAAIGLTALNAVMDVDQYLARKPIPSFKGAEPKPPTESFTEYHGPEEAPNPAYPAPAYVLNRLATYPTADQVAASPELQTQTQQQMKSDFHAGELQAVERVLTQRMQAAYPGRPLDPKQIRQLSEAALADINSDRGSANAGPAEPEGTPAPQQVGAFLGFLDDAVAKVDPNQPAPAGSKPGQIIITPQDRAALQKGDKTTLIGRYVTTDGRVEPVMVKKSGNGVTGEFPVYGNQPTVQLNNNLRQAKPADKPGNWDGSRPSCPYVYAFDGRRFRLMNDIISVSRGLGHEYDDWMLVPSRPLTSGTGELRIAETRNEESFLDRLALWAVGAPRGRELAATPDGQVLAVGPVRPPSAVGFTSRGATAGAPPSARSLAAVDAKGPGLFDGDRLTASFAAPGRAAVLVLSVDGFETAGADGAPLGRRPAIQVEARSSRGPGSAPRWVPAGVVYPRERTATTALDLSRFASGGRVAVRLTATSCNAGKYQLLDRLGLSSAPVARARLRRIRLSFATLGRAAARGAADVRSDLSVTDGRRAHTVPGDVIRLRFRAPPTGSLLLLSRGWYRPLN
jgi:hypothetical protein